MESVGWQRGGSKVPRNQSIRTILHRNQGWSIVEIVVATAILSFVLVSTGLMFAMTRTQPVQTGGDRSALTVAIQKMEELKSLPYDHPDLIAGGPHVPPDNPVTIDDRGTDLDETDDIKAYLRWIVNDVDDPGNGTGSTDYKVLRVEISREPLFRKETRMVWLESIVTP